MSDDSIRVSPATMTINVDVDRLTASKLVEIAEMAANTLGGGSSVSVVLVPGHGGDDVRGTVPYVPAHYAFVVTGQVGVNS